MTELARRWTAKWIEPVESAPYLEVQRPAYYLATTFRADGPIRRATLWLTAHGLAEMFINGVRVGDDELLPGFTAYRKRLEVHTFDVTPLIEPGANGLGGILSDGWWRGQHSSERATDSYGPTTALFAELRVDRCSGETFVVASDETWRSTPSHILAADLIAGEAHDMRRRIPDWSSGDADRTRWDAVRVADYDLSRLTPALGPPVRQMEELRPKSVVERALGRRVIDFGQNINGWVRLSQLGPKGSEIRLVYGERLNDAGDVDQSNVSHADRFPDRSFQTDFVISAGDGASFEPRHSTKGFRYVSLEGLHEPLSGEALSAIVVHSELRRIGGFACSDERLNKLHAAVEWSFRSNACAVPTDCPTRERAAWTGDYQTFIETAAFLYDVTDFSRRWLFDVAAEQWPDGAILNYVPDPHDFGLESNARWRSAQSSAGWGDAICHVPWEIYRATGRTDVLAPFKEAMRRWIDFNLKRAASARHPSRSAARPAPSPHEHYLLDTGFHFGEWAEPSAPNNPAEMFAQVLSADHGATATAYLYRSLVEFTCISSILGAPESEYEAAAENVLGAWRAEFIDDQGAIVPHTQANLVRALAFGLLPQQHRQRAADDLVALIRAADTHLGTGFLATPYLLPALADHGHLGVAYELLLQRTPPSWLHMIESGATTMWELWGGLDGKGEGSLNHYGKGAVASFLHRYVAGLQIIDPGYKRFRVAPRPGGGINSASAWHESPHGRIDVAWSLSRDEGVVELSVPNGATAELVLPDGAHELLGHGAHIRRWTP